MPAETDPYRWILAARAAVDWTQKAIDLASARLDEINPIDNLEETQAIRKALKCLRAALPHLLPIRDN